MKKLYHGRSLAYPKENVRVDEASMATMADKLKVIKGIVDAYAKNHLVRQYAIKVLRDAGAQARDYRAQVQAIFNFVRDHMLYVHEKKETFQTPLYTLNHMEGDCLPSSTLVLRGDSKVSITSLSPGDKIACAEGWTTVEEVWISGEKPILAFELDNDCTLRCSPEHRVFKDSGAEVRAFDLKIDDCLLSPAKLSGEETTWIGVGSAKSLKIVGIRSEPEEICADLKTDKGNLWLPESDTIVHNCDDFSILASSLLESINIPTRLRLIGESGHGPVQWKHIFLRAGLPPKAPTEWIALETTIPAMDLGDEPLEWAERLKKQSM